MNKEKIFNMLHKIKVGMGKTTRFISKSFLILFILFIVLGCVVGGYVGIKFLPILDDYRELAYEKFDEIGPNTFTYLSDTVIYGKNNELISEINVGNYKYVKIDDVSKWVQGGYIAVEDKRFKVHNGIDYKALIRASVSLVKNKGDVTQGGSTITQQVLKNNLLSQERTFRRKFIEFFLAPEFEKKYSKKDIMEFYVNTNFYGNNCYGIEAASQYYFGKSAKDLDIGESALFVGMSNNATLYNPRKNYDLVIEKWKFVLSEMLKEEVITEKEYNDTIELGLDFLYEREQRVKEDYLTSYAIHSTVLSLMEQDNFEFKYLFKDETDYKTYREEYTEVYTEKADNIRAGGYSIYTSLDKEMQNELQRIIDKSTSRFDEKSDDGRYAFQSAGVVVNTKTGYVEAIVGGRGVEDEFNRGFLAKRQPGSSIKPLVVYAPAYNSGLYYPSMIMTDKDDPTDKYYPKNYSGGFLGNMPIKEAVGRSTNTIAYQIMKSIGANTGLEYLANMRFDTMSNVDNNNTAVSLGGFTYGVRVVDMAKGYSTLVNQGNYIDNNCIIKIDYQNEGTIFKEDSAELSIFEEDAAYMMVDTLKGVLYEYYGTGGGRKLSNAIAIAKTGTTNGAKDVWFCGSTTYYSMAVWCGYDTPRETNLTGGSIPGEIWENMMDYLHEGKEKVDFKRPESVIDLPIDYLGNAVNYNSGRYGMFSQTLLDKAESERLAIIERRKIEKDDALVEEITSQLGALKIYKITDIDALEYLENRYNSLSNSISKVIQEDKKIVLESNLRELKEFFSVDLRNIREYKNRLSVLKGFEQEITSEKETVELLNKLNAYVVTSKSDIEKIEKMYSEVNNKINNLVDKNKKDYYNSKYTEIKGYKEILLKSYREEIRIELENKKQKALEDLEIKLIQLEGVFEYYEGVESLFTNIEKTIAECNELDVNIETQKLKYDNLKKYILSLKPIIPEIQIPDENTPNENTTDENTTDESDILSNN